LAAEQTPTEADPAGDFYAFEKGARTPTATDSQTSALRTISPGSTKGKRKDLVAAYKQVSDYR
jgi:hypothetical protein